MYSLGSTYSEDFEMTFENEIEQWENKLEKDAISLSINVPF